MRRLASISALLTAYAFFLLFNHFTSWLLLGATGHLSAWQMQLADWWIAGP